MSEHANRNAQLAVLARGAVNRGEQPTSRRAGRDEGAGDVAMPAEEGGCSPRRVGALAGGGRGGAFEQEVGHTAERGCDDHERALVASDEADGPLDRRDIGEGGTAELPDLEWSRLLVCHGHLGAVEDEEDGTATRSMARRTAS